ncbi:hypothetical protein SETIT_4G228800v2 [Setaria italica]|uniref:Uncharacterized protein n=1 Tax=Setaria italica TaxID=4555 RepID=A0A368QX80_SETIT|nr:hypothetical protein SETIT_4G228800v2 [Setaria italica]
MASMQLRASTTTMVLPCFAARGAARAPPTTLHLLHKFQSKKEDEKPSKDASPPGIDDGSSDENYNQGSYGHNNVNMK